MLSDRRKSTGELVRKAFEILLAHPEGMTPYAVLQCFQQELPEQYRRHSQSQKIWDGLLYGTVAPTKALWLSNNEGRWLITEAGRQAFYQFQDPEQFLAEAGRHSLKGWLTVRFPTLYALGCKARYQATIEYRLVRRIGLRRLAR